jgi:hypothetical protein
MRPQWDGVVQCPLEHAKRGFAEFGPSDREGFGSGPLDWSVERWTRPAFPVYPTFARDHEYTRLGTLSLLAGIDLLTGKVHALVRDRHRSREFIEFLKLLDAAYPASTAIKLILDNHSAHISRETTAWLATRPAGRQDICVPQPARFRVHGGPAAASSTTRVHSRDPLALSHASDASQALASGVIVGSLPDRGRSSRAAKGP